MNRGYSGSGIRICYTVIFIDRINVEWGECQDASDESHSCQSTQCENEEAACRSGQCVDKQAIFDLQRNCLDNSDEHNDNFTYSHIELFQCGPHDTRHGVPPVRVNDLIPDCPNSKDEPLYLAVIHKLATQNVCLPHALPCLQFHSQCFPIEKLCVYEVDIEQQMMYCRNGFHMKKCTNFFLQPDLQVCIIVLYSSTLHL